MTREAARRDDVRQCDPEGHQQPKEVTPAGAIRPRIRELAQVRRRFGYRRLHFLLKREGMATNQKRLRRPYREEGLQVRKRGGRKRAPLALPSRPNERWSLDFVSDTFTDGRRFRTLAVIDDWALVADTSLSGARVARELDAIIAVRGKPMTYISDNGTELTSMAIPAGSKERVSTGTTSSRTSRNRTRSSRASTVRFATSA